jgi:hypothetical protein
MGTGGWPMSLERAVMLLTLATDAVLAGDGAVIDDDIKPELRAAIRCTTRWLRMEPQDGQRLPYNKATEGQ